MNLINAGLKDTDFNKAESLLRRGEKFSLGARNDLVIHYDDSFLPFDSPYRYGDVPLDSTWNHLSRWMMEEKIQFPCFCWVSDYTKNPCEGEEEGNPGTIDIITSEGRKNRRGTSWGYITPLTKDELRKYVSPR